MVPNGGTLAAVYFVFGVAFAAFAGWSASNSMRVTWNRLGFLVAAAAFALHIGYEANSKHATNILACTSMPQQIS